MLNTIIRWKRCLVMGMRIYLIYMIRWDKREEIRNVLVDSIADMYMFSNKDYIITAKSYWEHTIRTFEKLNVRLSVANADELVLAEGMDITDDRLVYTACICTIWNGALRREVIERATKMVRHKISGYIDGVITTI